MTPRLASSGVVSLVPRSQRACAQVLDILAIARAAEVGDPTATEQLAVLARLLDIRATADVSTREGESATPGVPTCAVATISDIRRAAA